MFVLYLMPWFCLKFVLHLNSFEIFQSFSSSPAIPTTTHFDQMKSVNKKVSRQINWIKCNNRHGQFQNDLFFIWQIEHKRSVCDSVCSVYHDNLFIFERNNNINSTRQPSNFTELARIVAFSAVKINKVQSFVVVCVFFFNDYKSFPFWSVRILILLSFEIFLTDSPFRLSALSLCTRWFQQTNIAFEVSRTGRMSIVIFGVFHFVVFLESVNSIDKSFSLWLKKNSSISKWMTSAISDRFINRVHPIIFLSILIDFIHLKHLISSFARFFTTHTHLILISN